MGIVGHLAFDRKLNITRISPDCPIGLAVPINLLDGICISPCIPQFTGFDGRDAIEMSGAKGYGSVPNFRLK